MNYLMEQMSLLLGNDFMKGGMFLMLMGGAMAYLRHVPLILFQWMKLLLVVELQIVNTDMTHLWVKNWLSLQNSKRASRRLTAYCAHVGSSNATSRDVAKVTPGPGWHLYWYRGVPIITHYRRHEAKSAGTTYVEEFDMEFLTLSRTLVPEFVEHIKDTYDEMHKDTIKVYTPTSYGDWLITNRLKRRGKRSVILPKQQEESLFNDVESFLNRQEWYDDRSVPYRRGYLLYGPPGNGKSSLVGSIASEFGLDIYILTLGSEQLNDDSLLSLIANIGPGAILLIEDIDCAFTCREGKTVSLSALLNAIDGVNAGEGRLLFMTTNHKDRLDLALIRDGRIDKDVPIENPTEDQIKRMYKRFRDDDPTEFVEKSRGLCMAQIQGRLLHAETT